MTWTHVALIWTYTAGLALYVMTVRKLPRSSAAVVLGAIGWPVSAPLELAYRAAKPAIQRYLDKVLP